MTVNKTISYRSIIMAVAMLWIMLFHANITTNISIIDNIIKVGYCGVDMFLMASGIGNYFSYMRDRSPTDFMKRRIKKLCIPYFIFIIFFCAYEILICNKGIIYIPGNLIAIQSLSHAGWFFNWYLGLLWICYLLTPYFAIICEKNNLKKDILFVLFLIFLSFTFFNDRWLIIVFTRLPIYYMGMIVAKNSSKKMNRTVIVILLKMFIFGLSFLAISYKCFPDKLWMYGLHWYPFIFITPFMCYFIACFVSIIEKKNSFILKIMKKIGESTFELYLTHIFIFQVIEELINKKIINSHVIIIWISEFVLAFVFAYILKTVSLFVQKKFKFTS